MFIRRKQGKKGVCLMSKKDWKNIFAVLGNVAQKHKDVLISMVFLSVFVGVRPFISVILTGMLVDAVYEGESLEQLLRYAAVGVGGIFLMSADRKSTRLNSSH